MGKIVQDGYIKLLALKIRHLETTVIMEKNTNSKKALEEFKNEYSKEKNVAILVIHMPSLSDVSYNDFMKVVSTLHSADHVKELLLHTEGKNIEEKRAIDSE